VASGAPVAQEGACVGTSVGATLIEMAIELDSEMVPAGTITFDVTNAGTVEHEFVVIATDLAVDQLPVKDGVVDETQLQVLGEIEGVQPGLSGSLTLDLAPGRYVIICNLPGHYLAGMRTELTVQ
jgi:uncharacterized cupredoxin-like copper-binding protein